MRFGHYKTIIVKEVISKAKEDGLNIMIGGDMNAHIWELDKCENKNGILLKSTMDDINLQILNCVWDSMKGATWFSEKSESGGLLFPNNTLKNFTYT